jgi:UDP-N-acetylmuramate dehydrogenase
MIASGQASVLEELGDLFGRRFQRNIPLAPYTSARIGGPATGLIIAGDRDELAEAVVAIWERAVPYFVLGGGSNILVSDRGFSGVVVLNRARQVVFPPAEGPLRIWAESGANLGLIARQAAARGLAGIGWAAGIPGTVGGAVTGNAGAHGSEISAALAVAEILQRTGEREDWGPERLELTYRNSLIKRRPGEHLVLSAAFAVGRASSEEIEAELDEFLTYRRRTQPAGASMGSMFKNPPGDYAGRLIEGAGLKGLQVGKAQISPLHANFFVNHGVATSSDVYRLIQSARQSVAQKYGIDLDLEIELIGEWEEDAVC